MEGLPDFRQIAGYFRDSETGNDYADQRYQSPGYGRFLTSDRVAGQASDPGSWNKYAYAGSDPINRVDRTGREWCAVDPETDLINYDECASDTVCANPGAANNPLAWEDICVFGQWIGPDDGSEGGGGEGGGGGGGGGGSAGGSGNTSGNSFATPGATPQLQGELYNALQIALGALYNKQGCASLFGIGVRGNVVYTPSDILNALYELNQKFGSISFGKVPQTPGTTRVAPLRREAF